VQEVKFISNRKGRKIKQISQRKKNVQTLVPIGKRPHIYASKGDTRVTEIPDLSSNTLGYEGYALDAENAAEMARLMVQDRVLTQAMGGVLPEQPDASGIHRALDIGCGPGGWILSLVKQYPHIDGVGIDISHLMVEYATSLAASQELTNARFQVMDATQPLLFSDNTFDLVNGRILVGFLSKPQWPALVQSVFALLGLGGFYA
jgi:tRNA G46 methylase TrmB